jgi:hypothetical protein
MRLHHIRNILLMLTLLGAIVAWAAPYLPQSSLKMQDEVTTLADMDRLHLVVEPFPLEIRDRGIVEPDVEAAWREDLEKAGLTVAGGPDVPQLHLWLATREHFDVPDGFGYFTSVTLEQPVIVKRLGREASIPTWTGIRWGMMHRRDVRKQINLELDSLLDQFLVRWRQARSLEKEPGADH